MAYFKLTLRDNGVEKEKVIQAQKGDYPYRDGEVVCRGDVGDDVWEFSRNYRWNGYGNEWIYIWLSTDLSKKFGLKWRVFKFNNRIYGLNIYQIKNIEPCSKKYYHEHKDIVGEARKNSYVIRDSQRQKVYNGERFIKNDKPMKKYETEIFIRNVIESKTWKELNKKFSVMKDRPVDVDLSPRGKNFAHGGAMGIELPEWARVKGVILHELSHVIVNRTYGYDIRRERKIQGHGKEFCYFFLMLVNEFYNDALQELVYGFDLWEVKYLTEFDGYNFKLDILDK